MARKKSSSKKSTSKKDDALDLLMQLLAIPGKSGDELQVAQFVCEQLKKAGLNDSAIKIDTANKKTPIKGDVGNLIVKLPGTMKADRRMLMAHMDTVPVCVGSKPEKKGNFVRSKDPKTALLHLERGRPGRVGLEASKASDCPMTSVDFRAVRQPH